MQTIMQLIYVSLAPLLSLHPSLSFEFPVVWQHSAHLCFDVQESCHHGASFGSGRWHRGPEECKSANFALPYVSSLLCYNYANSVFPFIPYCSHSHARMVPPQQWLSRLGSLTVQVQSKCFFRRVLRSKPKTRWAEVHILKFETKIVDRRKSSEIHQQHHPYNLNF